ncbi:MAG: PIN domain-containing protein [Elusimicrobia bacterium]|nr:PIN domain-containing protein [Elusimicrobiota bacterium]
MMSPEYLLDTNTVIYWLKGNKGIENKVGDIGPEKIGIPFPAACELYYGAFKSQHQEKNTDKLRELFLRIPILSVQESEAELFGKIKAALEASGKTADDADLLIASCALCLRATLVTHNTRHFKWIPNLRIEDWLV